jgi:hypothetical protein
MIENQSLSLKSCELVVAVSVTRLPVSVAASVTLRYGPLAASVGDELKPELA